MKKMIFYYVLDLKETPISASQLRPIKMLQGFKNLGYDVIEITGDSKTRKSIISTLTDEILKDVEFLYMESATIPFFLTDRDHIPRNFLLEYNFFTYLREIYKIPVSVFYRDIHWKFVMSNFLVYLCHRIELLYLKSVVDLVYLPSHNMQKYLKIFTMVNDLPPGHSNTENFTPSFPIGDAKHIWKLLYVGGLGYFYNLTTFFTSLSSLSNVHAVFSFRREEWEKEKYHYESSISNNTKIVFKSPQKISECYSDSDIFILLINHIEYWDFAIPYKFYEAVGYGKPILASKGTIVAEIVERENIGWVLENTKEAIVDFFRNLTFSEYLEKKNTIISYSKMNTWEQRCIKVEKDLGKLKRVL